MGHERGPIVAAAAAVALIAIRDLVTLLPFLVLVPLLILERRQAGRGQIAIPWRRVNEVTTVVMAALVVAECLTLLVPALAEDPGIAGWETPTPVTSTPDVFVILADAHGREDVLRGQYGYDPRAFSEALRALGLDIAPQARSNYFLTRFSLASFLNGAHLWDLGQDLDAPASDDTARRAVSDNRAFRLLDELGYETVVVSSGYEHLGLRSADRFIDTGEPGELEMLFLGQSLPGRLLQAWTPDLLRSLQRQRVLDELQTTDGLAIEPATRPQFMLVHLPLPHSPFIVDADCALLPDVNEAERHGLFRAGTPETAAQTADQTRCIDRLLPETLEAVIEARPDAVVIVMSDHGPDEHLDWFDPGQVGLDERSAILFAARTPGREGVFPADITLVNVLPRLFNAYLGTAIPFQPDDVYFGPDPVTGGFKKIGSPDIVQ